MPIINGNIIFEFGEILLFMSNLHYNNTHTTIWKYKTWKIICVKIAVDKGLNIALLMMLHDIFIRKYPIRNLRMVGNCNVENVENGSNDFQRWEWLEIVDYSRSFLEMPMKQENLELVIVDYSRNFLYW